MGIEEYIWKIFFKPLYLLGFHTLEMISKLNEVELNGLGDERPRLPQDEIVLIMMIGSISNQKTTRSKQGVMSNFPIIQAYVFNIPNS